MDENSEHGPISDPVDDLLAMHSPPPPGGTFQEALGRRTVKLLRRRRWGRQAALVSALAASYVAGVVTVQRIPKGSPPRQEEMVQQVPSPRSLPPPNPEKAAPAVQETAVALEWRAIDSPTPRPDLFRRAGDRYLNEAGDIRSALRCYRNALDSGSEADEKISPNDTWLLIALKEAKQREKLYARKSS